MPDESLYIPATPGPLFGVLHRSEDAEPPRAAVLFVPPALDEKRAAQGALARLARRLAASGCGVLRFDCYGTGDAAGESTEVTVSSMERDLAVAAGFLRAALPSAPLVLAGFRLGAGLALKLGAQVGAAKVAAVAPVASGASWLRQERGKSALRRSMIAREFAATRTEPAPAAGPGEAPAPAGVEEDLGGLPLSARFVEELQALDLSSGSAPAGGPETLVVQVSPRKTPLPEVERLAAHHRARIQCLSLEPFWQPLENPDVAALADCLGRFALGGAG